MTHTKNKFIIIIPARYASSRFPGKPLARLGGVEMIVRVCRKAKCACDNVMVATDDHRIEQCVKNAGFQAVMTDVNHQSGTDRVYEAYMKSGSDADVIINIQGDEPFIDPQQIELLMRCFDTDDTQIATLAREFDSSKGFEALADPNLVKLITSYNGNALYFSRSVIPYMRNTKESDWPKEHTYLTHIGIYAYRREALAQITALSKSSLEKCEKLEQLRWLQNGFNVKVAITDIPTIGIDTPEDLRDAENYLGQQEKHTNEC